MRARLTPMRSFDQSSMGAAFARPGMDPRQWCSVGLVGDKGVRIDPDLGPLVEVTLQPSGILVHARVGMGVAGNGEGEYYPFVPGDEVAVLIPEGDENAFPIVVARMANGLDRYPSTVAGASTAENKISFRRMRAPHIEEVDAGYLIRSARTGAQVGIDPAGQVVVGGGGGAQMFLSDDASGFVNEKAAIQISASGEVFLRADSTSVKLAADTSSVSTGGTINIGSAGQPGTGHAITLEQVVAILANFTAASVVAGFAGPAFVAAYGLNPQAAILALLTATIQGAAAPTPIGPAPGGDLTAIGIQPIINAALATQGPDPQAVGAPVFKPGVGRPGIVL